MNDLIDEARRLAALTDQVHGVGADSGVTPLRHDSPVVDLKFTLDVGDAFYVVYPTGLALPINRVNWFWEFETEVRIGTADQAARYARGKQIDPALVFPVAPSRVHGTCVRYGEEDYRLVQARSFPAWAGR